jgi:hypothetical protein
MPTPFIVTIDTEGDDVWSRPTRATTRNAAFLERFQVLCEDCGVRPTWLTNHEMACSPAFRRLGAAVIERGTAEIGMHLHAWDSPPLFPLTPRDHEYHPFLIEFPRPVMREKVHALTATLEDTFGVSMKSHRAGRWAFDERYADILLETGYRVDCSVTPHVSWRSHIGDPTGEGGTDYRSFPERAYWIDLSNVAREGTSDLLEVPMTVRRNWPARIDRFAARLDNATPRALKVAKAGAAVANRLRPRVLWLRPNGQRDAILRKVLAETRTSGVGHAEFMLHSSELMPGGSPTFTSEESIESLYRSLERLFQDLAPAFVPMTLSEFYAVARAAKSGAQGLPVARADDMP